MSKPTNPDTSENLAAQIDTPQRSTDDWGVSVPAKMELSGKVNASFAGQKSLVRDIGARMRQLSGLKVKETYRTPEIVAEIVDRLRSGETLLSISSDPNMPGHSTIHDWMGADPELKATINEAREVGTHALYDATIDIAFGGPFSTGDRLRDELVVKTLQHTASRRNPSQFGERLAIEASHSIAPVMLPAIALPLITDAEFDDVEDDNERGHDV